MASNNPYKNPKPRPDLCVHQKFAELDARKASVNEYRKELHDYYSKEEWKTCYVPPLFAPWHEDEVFERFANYTRKIEELVDQNDSDWEDDCDDDRKEDDYNQPIEIENSLKRKHSPNNLDRFSRAKKLLKLSLLKVKLEESLGKELHECLVENLERRFEYYTKNEIVRPGMDFFDDIRGGGHTIKLIYDFKKGLKDSDKPFAYTIGAHYWNRKCPEILALVDSSKHGFEAFTNVAKVLNAIIGMAGEKMVELVEGLSLSTVIPQMFTNKSLCLESISEEERQCFGYGNWFYINFADLSKYPCLKIQFSVGDIDEILNFYANKISKKIYDTDENTCSVKRGPIEEIPEIVPVSISENTPIGLILKAQRNRLILTKQVITLHLDNEEMFLKTAGMCNLDSFKDYIVANPQFNILKKKAFEYAMWNNKIDNIRHMISLGFNLKGDGNQRTPLMNAVQYGFEQVVQILIESGAPLEDKDCERWTALSIGSQALLHSDVDKAKRILQYLWDAGARTM